VGPVFKSERARRVHLQGFQRLRETDRGVARREKQNQVYRPRQLVCNASSPHPPPSRGSAATGRPSALTGPPMCGASPKQVTGAKNATRVTIGQSVGEGFNNLAVETVSSVYPPSRQGRVSAGDCVLSIRVQVHNQAAAFRIIAQPGSCPTQNHSRPGATACQLAARPAKLPTLLKRGKANLPPEYQCLIDQDTQHTALRRSCPV